jgi:hypothetical protein
MDVSNDRLENLLFSWSVENPGPPQAQVQFRNFHLVGLGRPLNKGFCLCLHLHYCDRLGTAVENSEADGLTV